MAGSSIGTRKMVSPACFLVVFFSHLAVDAPTVPVPGGGRAQRGEVRSRLGFAEALTPDDVTARDRRQVCALLFGGAVTHQRWPDPVHAHVLRAAWFVVGPHLLADHGLFPHRGAASPELRRPRHAEQSALGEEVAELLRDLQVGGIVGEGTQEVLRHMCFHQVAKIATQIRRVATHFEVHPLIGGQSL
jgi:hypothetical protein